MSDPILREHLREKLEDLRRGRDTNDEKSSFIHYYESELLYRLGDIKTAKKSLLKAIKLSPSDAEYWYNLGRIYQDQGKDKTAIRVYSRAMVLKPTLTDAGVNIAVILRKQNRYQEMLSMWDKILEINPGEDNTLITYGRYYLKQGEISKAFSFFQQALDHHNDFLPVLVFVGLQYFKIGNFASAQPLLEEAFVKEKQDCELVHSLAKIYTSQQNLQQAYQLWSHLLSLDPFHREALLELSKLKILRKDSDINDFLEATIRINPEIVLQLVKEQITNQLKETKSFQELLSMALQREELLSRPIYVDALDLEINAKRRNYSSCILEHFYDTLSDYGFTNIHFVYDDVYYHDEMQLKNSHKELKQKNIIQSIGWNKYLQTCLPTKAMETNGIIISTKDYSGVRMDSYLLEYLQKNTLKYEFRKTGIHVPKLFE
ncbi:MAG: tetratricopeptide repeat protein [Candidatus Heimdallarchaeota archaeon]|nr:tetratricopeptide repeat protein [Candidatus Heimdallarchaeota archaeon]